MKISILQNETKLRPGDFIRKVREGISGRIKAYNFAFLPISNKVFRKIREKGYHTGGKNMEKK